MKHNLKAVLFDHDGTLVNSEYTHYLHWKRIMEKYSADFHLSQYIEEFTGVPTYRNALDLINTFKLTVEPYILVAEKDEMSELSLIKKEYELMPYALETVKYFSEKNIKMCVVSGSNHNEVVHSINNHDMLEYFEFIVGGDDVEHSKPAPDVYLKALTDLNIDTKYCVALEDTASGIIAAKKAGIVCVAVKSEYSATQDFSKADVVKTNLREAKDWIIDNFQL